jgi:hypothetical protein
VHPRAQRWLQTSPNLGDHRLQAAYARSEIYATDDDLDTAKALDDLGIVAEGGHPTAREVLGGFVPVIVNSDHLDKLMNLREAALEENLTATGRLLRATTPQGHLLDRKINGTIMERADGRPLTLGERRSMARKPSRANLDRLMRDPHPMVAEILLKNPRITEDDVMRMAAFRPSNPLIQIEIGKAWSHHKRVRRTIVLNPGSPPAVAVPMLALLTRPELLEATRAADLPPVVRATASELWELRPPMAARNPPALPH